MRFCTALLLAAAMPPGVAQQRSERVAIDSARSYVDFEVKVLWLVGVHGRFGSVRGTITLDRFRNSAAVDANIDANVVAMRNKSHEDWVKSPEFFDAEHYPTIHFESELIPLKRLQSGGEIEGTLTLRGISQRVHFDLAKPDCPATQSDDCPVEAAGSIRRSDFGMSSRRGTLSDKVDLNFSIYTAPLPGAGR